MTSTTKTANGWAAKQKQLADLGKATQTLSLCKDPEVRDRYQRAKQAVTRLEAYMRSLPQDADNDARALAEKDLAKAALELDAAEKAYTPITVVLTFQALERDHLEELVRKHPAKEEDEEKGSEFHFDSFAPVLISAASLDEMPVEYAANALKTWSLGDSEDLWTAAWTVQRRKRSDLGKG